LQRTRVSPHVLSPEAMERVFGQALERDYSLLELLRRPNVSYDSLSSLINPSGCLDDPIAAEQVEIQAKYSGYIERQHAEIARRMDLESTRLPADLDYALVRGLSTEVQQKLNAHRPETLGQASRISGITPAAISLLLVHLKRGFANMPAQRQSA
jgi:tRNA uridine 5-carboxymethylaminomethyl modification enzyme